MFAKEHYRHSLLGRPLIGVVPGLDRVRVLDELGGRIQASESNGVIACDDPVR